MAPTVFENLARWEAEKQSATTKKTTRKTIEPATAGSGQASTAGVPEVLARLENWQAQRGMERVAKDVEDVVAMEAGSSLLQKFANILNVPNVTAGVGFQALAPQGLAHKNHVRTQIMSGAIKVPDEIKSAISKASDDDFVVDMGPNNTLHLKVVTGKEEKPNVPSAIMRGAVGTVKGTALGGPVSGIVQGVKGVLKGSKEIVKKVVKYELTDYDANSYYDWLREENEAGQARWKRGAGTALKAGLGSLTSKTAALNREGKQKIADMTSAIVEQAVPGTPQYALYSALGFGVDVAMPGALDFMPLLNRLGAKAISARNVAMLDKVVGAATETERTQESVSKSLLATPAVQNVMRRVATMPVLGPLAEMFGVRTPAHAAFESLVTGQKVEAQALKHDILEKLKHAVTVTAPAEAKAKGKVFRPRRIEEQSKKFLLWASSESGAGEIHRLLDAGQTLDPIFDNPNLLAKIYGENVEDVRKYVGYHDMYWLMRHLEDPSSGALLGGKTAKELRTVLDQVTQLKRESGAHLFEGELDYFPREVVGSYRYRGTPVRSSAMTPNSMKRRTTTILHEYFKSIYNAKKGLTPEHNVFQIIAGHAEDAVNYAMQKTIEDKMLLSGIARKLVRSADLDDAKTLSNAMEAIEQGGKGDIKVSSPQALSNKRRALMSKGVAGKLQDYDVWYPIGRIRFYLDDTKRMLTQALQEATDPWKKTVEKVARKVPSRDAAEIGHAIETLDTLYSKLKPDEMSAFLDALEAFSNKKVVQKYAKGSVAVTGRVPAYLVETPIADTIKAWTKAMYSPDAARVMAAVRKVQRPFTALMTSWNPGFWWRFNSFNPIQMMNSGISLPMIPARRVQGARALAKEGFTSFNGVKIANERVYDALKGSLSTFQGAVGANDYKLIVHGIYDIFNRNVVGRTTQKIFEKPGEILDAVDGMDRLAVGIDYVSKYAKKHNIKNEGEILRLLMTEGTEHSRRYMYDYPNVPEWVRKASAFFPFIRFYYKSIPDQMKMMFKFGLMHDVFAGKRSLQNAVGIPETPFEYEYLKKSSNIRFTDPDTGKQVMVDLSWPFEQMLSIDLARDMASGPLRMLGPVGQFPLHLMGMKTFPRLEPYRTSLKTGNPEKVDVPAYFVILPEDFVNSPGVQDVMGMGWRYDGDTGAKVLQMNKRALELWHDWNPWFLDLYQNTKNSKIIVSGGQLDEETFKEYAKEQAEALKDKRILSKQDIKEIRPFGREPMTNLRVYTDKYKFPGVSEYDPAQMLYAGMSRLQSLLSRQDIRGNLEISPTRGYSWVDPKVKIAELDEMNKLMGEFIKWNNDKWKYKSVDDVQAAIQKVMDGLKEEMD